MSAATEPATVTEQERRYLMARRQSLIIDLGAIEDYLGLSRSIIKKDDQRVRVIRMLDALTPGWELVLPTDGEHGDLKRWLEHFYVTHY